MNIGIVIGLIKALAPGVDPAVIEQAVTDWLDDHPEATTTVQDGSITEAKLAQDVLADLAEIEELKEAITNLDGEVNEYSEIAITQTAEGWRLNESDGLCSSNSSYKMLKFAVTAGQKVRVISDDRFQFQKAIQVPSTGTSNRVGETYGTGTFVLTVPSTATYLIVSTTKANSNASASLVTDNVQKALDGIDGKTDKAIVNLFDKTVTINEGKYLGTTMNTTTMVPTDLVTNSSYDTPDVIWPAKASSYVAVPKDFYGSIAIFNASGSRQQIKDQSALNIGKNCLYIETLSNTKYVGVSFSKAWYPDYKEKFILVVGRNELPEEYFGHDITFVDGSKVLIEDVVGLPDFIKEQDSKMCYALDDFNEAYAARVQAKQGANCLTITFVTDSHTDVADKSVNTDKKITNALNVGYVGDYLGQDMIIHGGDLLTFGYEAKTTPLHSLRTYLNRVWKYAKAPFLVAKGNHDDASFDTQTSCNNYSTDALILPEEWNAISMQYAKKCAVCPTNGRANYCYIDNERTKIRVFVLDSEDFDYHITEGVAEVNCGSVSAFSNDQLNFVANALLFADKDDPSEWAALFVSHRPIDTTTSVGYRMGNGDNLIRNYDIMLDIINAYKNGSSCDESGYGGYNQTEIDSHYYPYDVDIDYTSKGQGEVIGFLAGHTHVCNTSDNVGLNSSAKSWGYRYITCGSTGFYTLVYNRDTKKVDVFFYYGDKDQVQLPSAGATQHPIIGLTSSDLNEYGDWETSWT